MAMVEISSEQLHLLNASKDLLESMWQDPERGNAFKKMVKEIRPQAHIPELDIIDRVTKPYEEKLTAAEERFAKVEKDLSDFKEGLKTEKETKAFERQLNDVKKQGNFTEDGWKKVVNRMVEKNNLDVEAAAAWVKSHEPKASPSSGSNYSPQGFDMFGTSDKNDAWAELHNDPVKFADKEMTNILNNPERYQEMGGEL